MSDKKPAVYNRDEDPSYHAGLLRELEYKRRQGKDDAGVIAELERLEIEYPESLDAPAETEDPPTEDSPAEDPPASQTTEDSTPRQTRGRGR